MEDIFAMVVRSSIVGAVFIALILFIRWGTRKTTKFYVRILWLLLLAELLVPPVFKSPFQSMRGILEHAKVPASYEWMLKPTDGTADGKRDERQNTDALEHPEFRGEISVTAGGNLLENQKESEKTNNWRKLFALMSGTVFLSLIWLTGAVAMLFYYLEEFFRLYRRVRYAVRTEDGAWECDRIDTPFVLQGARSKIYLPLGLSGEKRADILAHEKQHIRCMDPWIKIVATLALALHWFNPMVWIAYSMIGKDLEMFCDEQVLKGKSLEEKKRYSQTLLDFAVEKKRNFHVMMQFGENGTGKRIEHILHVKKPKFVISMLLLVLVAGCGIFFLTSGSTNKTEYGSIEADLSDNEYVQAVKKTKESGYDGETVSYTWELDFDGNGKNEAFVAVGNETEGKLEGDIWFVNERKEAVLWKEAICAESGQEYFAADGKAYLFLTCVDGNAVQTDVYGITENSSDDAAEGRDKMPENVISFAGTKYLNENGTVTCNVTDMDGCYMPEDDCFVERTIKPYTFLYKNGVFVDMPGREVTEEEVKKMGNLGAVTVTLEMDGHDKDERQYILREDGTLQINLAHLYEDDISFTYVTCSLGEDKVWEHIKRGAGFYRLSLGTEKETKEESWLSRLKAEMEIPPSIEMPVDMAENIGEQSAVVGTAFVPDKDMADRIASAEDFSVDWHVKVQKSMEEETEIPAETIVVVQKTDSFQLYGTNQWSTMLVKTPDGSFVLSEENYVTSNYQIQPECREADFDGDGEMELAVKTAVAHGTGVFVEYLFMVDRNEAGAWCMYQFMEEDYLAQLEPHFDTVYRPEGVRLIFDGEEVGVASEIEQERLEQNYRYYAGAQIDFIMPEQGESIEMQAELVGAENGMIFAGEYPGHELDADVAYQGGGVWQLCDLKYADKEVNEQIRNTVLSYFSGNYGDVKQYGLAEDVEISDLEFQCEPMEVDILDIFYREQKLDEGSVQAVAVLRRGENDYLEELTVYLTAETPTGMDRNWRITRWYLEPY